MNEHEISIHVNNNFITLKYKVKLVKSKPMEVFLNISQYSQEKTCVGVSF